MKRRKWGIKILAIWICVMMLLQFTPAFAEQQGELDVSFDSGGNFGLYVINGPGGPANILYGSIEKYNTSSVKVRVGGESYSMSYVAADPVYGDCLKYTGNGIEAVFDITSVGNPITGGSGESADMAEFKFYLRNTGDASVNVGALAFYDTMVGGNDQAPLYIPGVGKSVNETTYSGASVPSTIYSYQVDDPANPGLVAAFLTNYNGNNAPDRITLGNYGQMCYVGYDYSGNSTQIGDSAVLAQWSDRALAAGETLELSMYMGRGKVTAASGTKLQLSSNGDAQIGPGNTYQVLQTVRNISGEGLTNVQAGITLPAGWSFASGSSSATKPALLAGEDWAITWQLIAPPGATSASFGLTTQVQGDDTTLVSMALDQNNIGADVPSASAPIVSISGNGQAIANGASSPSAANGTDFGGINVAGGPVTHTFTIENTGTATLNLSGVALSGDTADFVLTGPASMSVAQGASITFTVAFDPSATGLCQAAVNITSDDTANSPYSFAISGTGTKPAAGVSCNGQHIANGDVSPATADGTDFGNASVADATVERTFTVQNTGTGSLTLADITVSGDNASDFTVAAPETLAIPAGGSGEFKITFDPSFTGNRAATVSIASDDENTPYTFAVKGYGLNNQNYITSFSLDGFTPEVTGSISGTDITLNVPHGTVVKALVASFETEGVSVKVGSTAQESGVTANDFTHPVVYTVEAEDGTRRQYTVTVHILPAVDATLSSINLGITNITGLSPGKQQYDVDVPNGTNPAVLTPSAVASDTNATVGAWAYDAAGRSWSVTVTAEDGVTQLTYTVAVHVLPAASTTLPCLDISTGSNVDGSQGSSNGSSGAAPGGGIVLTQTSGGYKATVEYLTGSLVFNPKAPQGSTVIVNGKVITSGNVALPLKVGTNNVQVQIIQPDGSAASFTMKVTRKAQGRGLNDLDIISGYLRPDIRSNLTSYEAGIPYTVTAFKVLVRANDPKAVITVNGTRVVSGHASRAIPITVRTPVLVTVVVKDSTGLIKVYHVKAIRSRYKSDNNYMSSLTVIGGRPTSGFSKYKTSYTINVKHSVASIRFRPGSTFVVAKVRVKGSLVNHGATSGAIPLKVGKNIVRITVTAENGAVRTYTFTVNRAK